MKCQGMNCFKTNFKQLIYVSLTKETSTRIVENANNLL